MIAAIRALPRPRLGIPSMPDWEVLRRRLLIAALLAGILAAAYMLWLRNSALVAVDTVEVHGAESRPDLQAAIESAARKTTTLHVDVGALEAAIAGDPAVRSISADADFPHGLTVNVDLRTPAGWVDGAVVAADGVVLDQSSERPEGVPVIEVDNPQLGGDRAAGDALTVAHALGGAPEPLVKYLRRGRVDLEYGIVVEIDPGIDLRFGDASRTELKWRAAAAVLADPQLENASYIDLSVPDRPVAGTS